VNVRTERGPGSPPEQTSTKVEYHPTVVGNERLIALAGFVLLVLIITEIVITTNLHAFMPVHIFIGIFLTFPLLIKMGSTGYRFVSYYTGSPAFVKKGPPRLVMRLLAPLLLIATISLVVSGITLALLGPTNALSVWVLRLHALSVICWLPLLALHVGSYIWRVPRLILADWRKRYSHLASGRGWRYGITLIALLAGVSAAVLLLPHMNPWVAWEPNLPHNIPGTLLAALFFACLSGLGGWVILKPWRWRE